MNRMNVTYTVEQDLCCGCGVCKGICPKACISWEKKNGLYLPKIEGSQCVGCGLCAEVCPGLTHRYEPMETAIQTVTGPVLECFNAWSKDAQLRHVGASGGVISTMIRELLATGRYDGAFCLDSYDYRTQLRTRLYTAEEIAAVWAESGAPKSRYLPVSHEAAVTYLKENRDAKLIFVGTSCAIRGLQNAVARLKLHREQYLFIGLFCDMVFNYNVLPYFSDTYASGTPLEALHFKNKESGGWPGDMKLFPREKAPFYVPLAERAKAKAYFMPERCLYCTDKLNVCADISLGDNYTGIDSSELGSNSVIIRTEPGLAAWNVVSDSLEIRKVEIEAIQKAQYLEGRINNLYFSDEKRKHSGLAADLNPGVPRENDSRDYEAARKEKIQRLRAGAVYGENPERIKNQIKKDCKKPNPVIQFIRRGVRFIRRRLK